MFLGNYTYAIDPKGRLAIPVKFREDFRSGVVLTRGFDKCVLAYPESSWEQIAQDMAALPLTRSNNRRVARTMFSNAFDASLDRQGRMLLPQPLREYAAISDNVVIAGQYTYLELWSEVLWAAEKALMDEQAWQTAEAVETARP